MRVTAVFATERLALVEGLGVDRVIYDRVEDFTRMSSGTTPCSMPSARVRSADAGTSEAGRDLLVLGPGPALPEPAAGTRHAAAPREEGPVPHPNDRPGDSAVLRDRIEAGVFRPVIDRQYPFDQIVEASRYVETGQKVGNIEGGP